MQLFQYFWTFHTDIFNIFVINFECYVNINKKNVYKAKNFYYIFKNIFL